MTPEMKRDGCPSREWLRRMADREDQFESIAVGGLAADAGMLEASVSTSSPRVFGRLIEFARRARGLSVENLARSADLDLAELLAVEDMGKTPTPRTVFQLSKVLRLSTNKLMELAGLAEPRDSSLNQAALRFIARSEPTANLSREEREAFEEFIKVLVETSEGLEVPS